MEVAEGGGQGHGRGAVVVGGVEALVQEAAQFVIEWRGGHDPVVRVYFVPYKPYPARVVKYIFFTDGMGLQGAARRRGRMVAAGFGEAVGEVVGAGGDVRAAEVVLFVDLDDGVFLKDSVLFGPVAEPT